MSLKPELVTKAIAEAKSTSARRRFEQSIDLVVTFRDIDIKKPENKFSLTVTLPHAIPNKLNKICMIASGSMVLSARDAGVDLVQPNADLKPIVDRYRRSVRIKIKDQPQVMARVGSEAMNEKELVENINAVLEEIFKKVSPEKVRAIYVKLTMGSPIKLTLSQ